MFVLTSQLVDMQIFAAPRIILKPLVPTIPCFASIVVSLMEKVNYKWKQNYDKVVLFLLFILIYECDESNMYFVYTALCGLWP